MDTKRALEKANGDFKKAITVLREKGISIAKKPKAALAVEGKHKKYYQMNCLLGQPFLKIQTRV
jgi:translation elongation factor EF-Ts